MTHKNSQKKTSHADVMQGMPEEYNLTPVVEFMFNANDGLAHSKPSRLCRHILPSRELLVEQIEALKSVLFPGYFGISDITQKNMRYHVGATLDKVMRVMQDQVKRGMCFVCDRTKPDCDECEREARQKTRLFLESLPRVRHLLAADVQASFEGDPAATCADEAIFCYPGVSALNNYRLAHELYKLEVPLLPRMISEHAHSMTGIDIHPGASIGESFFIDHGTGVVIGETCVIGNRVRVYQGVTLGAKSFPVDKHGNPMKGIARHPIVEDEVIIYGGATILGRVTIGKGSVIGGNVWITESVPPESKITQAGHRYNTFTEGAGI